jgi:hypothetical protein
VVGSARPKYASLRYAKLGRIDENGQLPTGWGPEHLTDLEIVDIDLRPEMLGVSCSFKIDPALPGEFAGMALGEYAQIEQDEPFALSTQIELSDAVGISQVYLLIREWVNGGEYVGQATRIVELTPEPSTTLVVRAGRSPGHVVQPALALRRPQGAVAEGTITIRKLIFGSLYAHPEWLTG